MAEAAILGVVIVALLIERYLSNRAHAEEVVRLTSAVIAKNAGELRMMDEVWKPKDTFVPDGWTPPEPTGLPDGYEGQAGIS